MAWLTVRGLSDATCSSALSCGISELANIRGSGCSIASTWTRSRRVQPDPPGLNSDDPRLLPPWRGSSPFSARFRPCSRAGRAFFSSPCFLGVAHRILSGRRLLSCGSSAARPSPASSSGYFSTVRARSAVSAIRIIGTFVPKLIHRLRITPHSRSTPSGRSPRNAGWRHEHQRFRGPAWRTGHRRPRHDSAESAVRRCRDRSNLR
ncbi:hypothetical protein E7742_21250 [Rhodococcus sp. SGAir0479]|nr:hypothetical protein E7742_21250 [Rhodococcus sp. SGAir0479]